MFLCFYIPIFSIDEEIYGIPSYRNHSNDLQFKFINWIFARWHFSFHSVYMIIGKLGYSKLTGVVRTLSHVTELLGKKLFRDFQDGPKYN